MTPDRPGFVGGEFLSERVPSYILPDRLRWAYSLPGPLERQRQVESEQSSPGLDLALVHVALPEEGCEGLYIVPSSSPYNTSPKPNAGIHYGQAAFGGGSFYAKVDNVGRLAGANLILFDQRLQRTVASIEALGFNVPEDQRVRFKQAVFDYCTIMAEHLLTNNDEVFPRVYVRDAIARGTSKWGVAPPVGTPLDYSCIAWRWGAYLSEEAYKEGASCCVIPGQQRTSRLIGKVSGNYTTAGRAGQLARELGHTEVLYVARYAIDENNNKIPITYDLADGRQLYEHGRVVPADGSGEDIAFIQGNTLIIPPSDTGILAGTTQQYIRDFLAPSLGMDVIEKPLTLAQINEEQPGMIYIGNAVQVCPCREIVVYDDDLQRQQVIELPVGGKVAQLVESYQDELSGRTEITAGTLRTELDIKAGASAREKIKAAYPGWF